MTLSQKYPYSIKTLKSTHLLTFDASTSHCGYQISKLEFEQIL